MEINPTPLAYQCHGMKPCPLTLGHHLVTLCTFSCGDIHCASCGAWPFTKCGDKANTTSIAIPCHGALGPSLCTTFVHFGLQTHTQCRLQCLAISQMQRCTQHYLHSYACPGMEPPCPKAITLHHFLPSYSWRHALRPLQSLTVHPW